ncbi:nickel pincer cofactor biosynthesis protein LarC [Alkalibacter mobilis]|uniref:nickel pincer cofactor biosynthesis protein LarC n=1 Tax=Alkalibacter mobilis TaxID=2787712 RepID=UPI00189F32BF|nr:nickel pincer cofactor biosynthesis protein LarC [Alkalibacter mobilis]MBF7097360.1 nickel pincer cofactor biosynthesis protein LarC [Alkalibacter mobilis]
MKVLYYDCFCGISGDMNLGAMVDLGVDPDHIQKELAKLSVADEFDVSFTKGEKRGITGIKADVILKGNDQTHRHLSDVNKIIEESSLSNYVKDTSKAIFRIIAESEGRVHGKSAESVHFHEVGAIDSIVDIVGAAICLEYLKPDMLISSPVQLGGGFVKCAHGTMPVPAPATIDILKGIPVKTGLVNSEATTPTGAAIIAHAAKRFNEGFSLPISKIGYGLGTKDFDVPNVLRVYLAEEHMANKGQLILEANIDDMNPELYSFVEEMFFENGALDVFKVPIIMKKSRPGVKLCVLCEPEVQHTMEELFFVHTTTLGIRKYPVEKILLDRSFVKVKTPWGEVTVKQGLKNGKIIKQKPEFDECVKIANENKIPMEKIYRFIWRNLEDI